MVPTPDLYVPLSSQFSVDVISIIDPSSFMYFPVISKDPYRKHQISILNVTYTGCGLRGYDPRHVKLRWPFATIINIFECNYTSARSYFICTILKVL